MRPETAAETIERLIDGGAAAAIGAACAFAGLVVLGSASLALGAGLSTMLLTWTLLRRIEAAPTLGNLPGFAAAPLPIEEDANELLLTEALAPESPDELLLDDILEELGPDARVVRLFAKAPLPTAGELSATIDRHLEAGNGRLQAPDASDALFNALADLRRSLR